MERKILYIVNPIAGIRTKKNLEQLIDVKTRERKIPFGITASAPDGNYRFAEDTIREKQFTDVVIAGGDGTVNQVIGALKHLPVQFGIIPCGSGNGLAFAAGIPSSPEKALELVFNGTAQHTDGFLINNQFACMLCGLGFDAKVAHDFARQPKRGLVTYVKQVLKNFFNARPYPFDLLLPEKKLSTEAFFISVANSNQFGNHFTIAPAASLNDGLLDIVIVTRQNKLRLLLATLQQIRGKNKPVAATYIEPQKGIIYFQAPAIRIANPGKAPLHIDGEPVDTVEGIEVKVLPRSFRLIRTKGGGK